MQGGLPTELHAQPVCLFRDKISGNQAGLKWVVGWSMLELDEVKGWVHYLLKWKAILGKHGVKVSGFLLCP